MIVLNTVQFNLGFTICELFGVARSSHYLAKKPKMPSLKQINLTLWVKQAFDQSKGSAGARTLSAIVSQQHNVKLTRYKGSAQKTEKNRAVKTFVEYF